MTRRIFSLIALIASTVCLAQSTGLDNCGLTSEPLLTSSELAYFKNTFFTDNTHSKNFDFEGKEIAYFSCDGTVSEDGKTVRWSESNAQVIGVEWELVARSDYVLGVTERSPGRLVFDGGTGSALATMDGSDDPIFQSFFAVGLLTKKGLQTFMREYGEEMASEVLSAGWFSI